MRIALILVVLAIVLLAIARKPKPVEDRQGQAVDAKQFFVAERDTLIVATFNVQTGKSLNGVRNPSAAAQAMAKADIVGVQEVYASSWLNKLGIGTSQTEIFAAPGQFGSLFSPTRYRWFRENRGNFILSKLALGAWKSTQLYDVSGKSFRNMTVAKLHWQGEEIAIINTHLHTGRGQNEQLSEVLQEFSFHSKAILFGDFNTRADNPQLLELLNLGENNTEVNDAIANASLDLGNAHRIDWILTKGFDVLDGAILQKGISDHPYYQVELKLTD